MVCEIICTILRRIWGVRYLECFQRDKIMVWATVVVQVVEGRVGGGLIEGKVCVPMARGWGCVVMM